MLPRKALYARNFLRSPRLEDDKASCLVGEVKVRTWSNRRIFSAEELALVQSVFDEACRAQEISPVSEDGERLAEAIIHHSQLGLSNDYRLMRSLEPAIAGRCTTTGFRKLLSLVRSRRIVGESRLGTRRL
jgi:hypothetical protein